MKKVIITGASDGLGFELAKLFIEQGIEVVSICRTEPKADTTFIQTDLTDKDSIAHTANVIKREHQKFDVLIHSAGLASRTPLGKLRYEESEQLFKLNVLGIIQLVSDLNDLIKTNGSDIVLIGSTIAYKAYPDQSVYTSSKWGILGFIKSLQLEYKDLPSRVIGFMPGGFKSRLHEKATGEKYDLSKYLEPIDLAKFMISILQLPKGLEVSEVIINRKTASL